jgi:hypothetical protein
LAADRCWDQADMGKEAGERWIAGARMANKIYFGIIFAF